jgi:plastocyanin
MNKFGLVCAAMCVVAALATACGGSSNGTQGSQTQTATATSSPSGEATKSSAPAAATAAAITIANMSFGAPITVTGGAQVSVKNDDSVEHSVTSDTAGKFDMDVDGKEQGSFTAPTEPGEYAFHCNYHPSMHGTLIVK